MYEFQPPTTMQYHFVSGICGGFLQDPISKFRNTGGISTAEPDPPARIPYTMSVITLRIRNNRKHIFS
jgi:hypothetical protein